MCNCFQIPKLGHIKKIQQTFGDCKSQVFLQSRDYIKDYKYAYKIFYKRLGFIIHSLHLDHIMTIFHATQPNQFYNTSKNEKLLIGKEFKSMHDGVEVQLVTKINTYIQIQYSSPADKAYLNKQQVVKLVFQYYYIFH